MVDRSRRAPSGSSGSGCSATPSFGGVSVTDIRFASGREFPPGAEVRLSEADRPGMVRVRVRMPWMANLVELGMVAFRNGVVLIPDEKVFPERDRASVVAG